jgi:hypothetical protein
LAAQGPGARAVGIRLVDGNFDRLINNEFISAMCQFIVSDHLLFQSFIDGDYLSRLYCADTVLWY